MSWLSYLLLGILVEHCHNNLSTAYGPAMYFDRLWEEAEKAHGSTISYDEMRSALDALIPLVDRAGNMYSFRLTRHDQAA